KRSRQAASSDRDRKGRFPGRSRADLIANAHLTAPRPMSDRGGSVAGLGKSRVEALTDGIFSAVMTILGLSLTLPFITGPINQPLPDFLEVLTGVLIYALSFFIVAVFWVGHHIVFLYVRRTDRPLIWLNNLFLMFIGLLPLSSTLLGRHDL